MAETKTESASAKTNSSSDRAIRSISFRLFPSPELAARLLKWLDIADDMDAHVKELAESFAKRGEKFTPAFMRDHYISLSGKRYRSLEKTGNLETLRDIERRRNYTTLPVGVQDILIRTAVAGFKSCQTNLERGHIDDFEIGPKDPPRRWKTLHFADKSMSVKRASGEVTLGPKMDFLPRDADRGLYISDSSIRFLMPVTTETTEHGSRAPTKHWGNHLLCRAEEGRAFEVRFAADTQKWYLILHYDATIKCAPFRLAVLAEILNNPDRTANRARSWILRSHSLFGGVMSHDNTVSIDLGVRTPWTCFDINRGNFYDIYPDFVTEMERVHGEIALLQSREDIAANVAGEGGGARTMKRKQKRGGARDIKRKRKRERMKAAGIKKKWKRNWRPNIRRRIQGLYDKLGARVRQAHGAFANHLIRNYDTIILPEFMTAGMIRKRRKVLKLPPMRDGGDTNNAPPREGGFTLRKATRQRLIAKALADPNRKKDVIITTEEYTTKQCPFCGLVNHKIGGKKVFKCENDECGFVGARDNTGAFNVCIRPVVKEEVAAVDSCIDVDGKERSKDRKDNEEALRLVQNEQKEDREVAIGDERIVTEDEQIAIEDRRPKQSPLSHASTASRSGHSEYLWPEVVVDEPEPIVEDATDAADVQRTLVPTPVNAQALDRHTTALILLPTHPLADTNMLPTPAPSSCCPSPGAPPRLEDGITQIANSFAGSGDDQAVSRSVETGRVDAQCYDITPVRRPAEYPVEWNPATSSSSREPLHFKTPAFHDRKRKASKAPKCDPDEKETDSSGDENIDVERKKRRNVNGLDLAKQEVEGACVDGL
ncbi:hypothetical protein HK104_009664 [Borealophlyctis nickersoniae]|nr:hypothetical protein HK104_009664 [Borealophlyctis nickersoniae]